MSGKYTHSPQSGSFNEARAGLVITAVGRSTMFTRGQYKQELNDEEGSVPDIWYFRSKPDVGQHMIAGKAC